MKPTALDAARARELITQKIAPFASRAGIGLDRITIEADLFALGILDSFDVVTILASLEEELNIAPVFPEETGKNFVLSINWLADGFLNGKSAT